ncbi:hypothetical protein [Paenibacillus woosongensis]|uniref:Uncharacterized protein n=1 Tax=Paenibacillus woosongensis TaxID=307580 RepID=A0A7X3CLX3_9BACL|nr:hypothetical protein [Paenibacillus woosongensis]MUG43587.1 hypothetical protein [Paenibacillus woosongensis]
MKAGDRLSTFRFPYKISLILLLGLTILAAPLPSLQNVQAHAQDGLYIQPDSFVIAQAAPAPEEAVRFAEQLIGKLSASKPFTAWKDARPEFQPLGPGMHAWLVTLTQDGKPIGYLILGAKPSGGYALIEYGAGSEPLFDTVALQRALAAESSASAHSASLPSHSSALQVEQLYAGPTLAEWRIVDKAGQAAGLQAQAARGESLPLQYRDARNADPLPDNESIWRRLLASPPELSSAIVASGSPAAIPDPPTITADSFDPNDNLIWLASDQLELTASSLTQELRQHKALIFAARSEDRNYTLPLPVYGYQTWEQGDDTAAIEHVYVMTGSAASPRFIAFNELAKAGQFYNSTGQ